MGLLLSLLGAGAVVAEGWFRDRGGREAVALGVAIALSADRLYGVLVDVGNRRRMYVLDRYERQRDERCDGGRQG